MPRLPALLLVLRTLPRLFNWIVTIIAAEEEKARKTDGQSQLLFELSLVLVTKRTEEVARSRLIHVGAQIVSEIVASSFFASGPNKLN